MGPDFAVASKPITLINSNERKKKKKKKRFVYDSSGLLFALWWVLSDPSRICKILISVRPLHMASKSLCCSTIVITFKCDIIHKSFVNIVASVHMCSVYSGRERFNIYRYNIQV